MNRTNKFLSLLLVILMLFSVIPLGTFTASAATSNASAVYKSAKKYTVEIQVSGNGFTATGTGFYISSDGNIVTNYHVIENATKITVLDSSKKKYACNKIVAYDVHKDLAIIDIDVKNHDYASLSYSYDTGNNIYTLGSSKGLTYTFSDGLISTKSRKITGYKEDMRFIQISAPISAGNSGGPLINSKGQVIGVNTFSQTAGQNLNFATPLSYLKTITHYNYTIAEFAKYSNLAYKTLKKAIILNGEYSSKYDWYKLYIPYTTNDGSFLSVSFYYDLYYDNIFLQYYFDSADNVYNSLSLFIEQDTNSYDLFGSFNGYDDCDGTASIVPGNYKKGNAIPFKYEKYNGLESDLSNLYSTCFETAILYWNDCLNDYGLSVGDFGFTKINSPKLSTSGKYTVTLNPNGGTVYSKTVYVGRGRKTILTTPVRTGYKCLGWSTSSKATSATYKCKSAYKPSKNVTLYAVWKLAAPSFSSLSGTKDSFTAKWKKTAISVSGYQIQYSTSSKFSGAKTVTVASYKTVSKKISKLKKGKKYYVRIRAYKTVSGKKCYSDWTSAKAVVTVAKPGATSISSLSGTKGGFKVKWKKQSSYATGYQIQYSTSSKFSGAKTVNVTSYKTVSKTISKLLAKKKYYVRIRTYKTVSKVNCYSAWSKAKAVTTKK